MKISVVTLSFNQDQYLDEAIQSVLSQEGHFDLEYIVIDPGSTDRSREIIASHGSSLAHVVMAPDAGPADGLNRGLTLASGDLFYYLNADDIVLPGAFAKAVKYFGSNSDVDVLCGSGYIVDESGQRIRRVMSDNFSAKRYAYGLCVALQQATFIRRPALTETGVRFNESNRVSWDGELLVHLSMAGRKFGRIEEELGCFRIHGASISGSGRLDDIATATHRRIFEEVMRRKFTPLDHYAGLTRRVFGHIVGRLVGGATSERYLRVPG